ncbi:MAG: chloride channel protein [Vicinamibacterales bacterium]
MAVAGAAGRLSRVRPEWQQNVRLTWFGAIVGVAAGFAAVGFRSLILLIQNLAYSQTWSFAASPFIDRPVSWWTIVLPALGGLVAGLLTHYVASEARGHGVPVVMEAIALHDGRIRPRLMAIQALASGITIGTGGSAGREGPIVQIGAAGGSTLGVLGRLPPYMTKILVGCGAAGGIAATFNTPIGGVLFAIEVVLLELKTRSFIPLVVASVFATVVSRLFLGRNPAFIVPPYAFEQPVELVYYLVLGVVAGLTAVGFVALLYKMEDVFEHSPIPGWLQPAIGGLLVGVIGAWVPAALGVGYETVSAVLLGQFGVMMLITFCVVKIIAVSLTLGSGGSGGVFAPSLFIGAALGGAFGTLAHGLTPDVTATSGAYALVGMAAVFAGTSRASLTAIVILFELTQDYRIILPVMFACVVSNLVAWTIEPDSVYTRKLRQRGVHVVHDLGPDVLARVRVADVMTKDHETIRASETIRQAYDRVLETGRKALPVLSEAGELVGIVTHLDVSRAFQQHAEDRPVSECMTTRLVTAYPDQLLLSIIGHFGELGQLPVVDRATPRQLLGVLTRADLLKARRAERQQELPPEPA